MSPELWDRTADGVFFWEKPMVGLSCTVGHNYSRLFMTRDTIQMLRPNVATKNEQQAFMGLKYHFLLSLHIPTPFLQVADLALHPFF